MSHYRMLGQKYECHELRIMGRLDVGENCLLMQYLAEISILDVCKLKAEYAGVLLYGFGNLNFTSQLPDISFTAQFVRHIAEDRRTNLLSEAMEKCLHCPKSSVCQVAAYLKSSRG